MTLPVSSSMLLVLGVVSGSRMAFSWAPTVLVSLPAPGSAPQPRSEGHLHRTALFALVWYAVPELHASIVFEHVFDDKLFF